MANDKEKRRGLVILLLLLILVLGLLAGWFFYQKKQVELAKIQTEQKLREVDSLHKVAMARIDSLLAENSRLMGINKQLDSLLQLKNDTLIKLRKQLAWAYAQRREYYKKWKEAMKKIEQYQAFTDSLQRVIAQLKAENTRLLASLENERQIRKQLEEEKANAQILRAGNVNGYGLKIKGGQEVQTHNASKAKKLEVCFVVFSHPIVEHGPKTAYVRIIGPDGKLFFDKNKGSGVFREKQHNAEVQYTAKQDFNYAGKDVDICIKWDKPENLKKFLPGQYQVEIFVDGYMAGKGDFELRKGLFVK